MSRSAKLRCWMPAMLAAMAIACPGMAEQGKPSASAPADTAPARPTGPQHVSFVTEDNIVIHAGYTPPPAAAEKKAPIAILLHMYRQDRSGYDPLIKPLHDAGFAVLAIDMRGHGQSVGPPEMQLAQRVMERDTKLFREMERDVAAGYVWLAGQPHVDLTRFVIVGASVGCSVALQYAAADRSVDGVVCLTPGTAYLGLDSIADVRAFGPRPLLLLASEPERAAAEELGPLAPKTTVEIVPGPAGDRMALHGTRMFGQVPGIEQKIVRFMLAAAGPPAADPVVASVHSHVYHQPDSGTAGRIHDKNRRWFSSSAEAEARGLRPPKPRSKRSPPGARADPLPEP